jgi:hypothetical protein
MQHVGQDRLDVAEVHGEGRDQQRQTQGQDELHEERQRDEQHRPRQPAVEQQQRDENGQAQQEMGQVRQHRHHRQHFGGKEHLLDQVAAGDQHPGGLGQGSLEPGPGQQAAEEEQ